MYWDLADACRYASANARPTTREPVKTIWEMIRCAYTPLLALDHRYPAARAYHLNNTRRRSLCKDLRIANRRLALQEQLFFFEQGRGTLAGWVAAEPRVS